MLPLSAQRHTSGAPAAVTTTSTMTVHRSMARRSVAWLIDDVAVLDSNGPEVHLPHRNR